MRREAGLVCLLLLCAAAAAGCHGRPAAVGGGTDLDSGTAPLPPFAAALPSLPLPEPRTPQHVHAKRMGATPTERSPGTHTSGESLVIPAGLGELEWAYYELPATAPVESVEGELIIIGGPAYVALSNYARGCWEFFPAVSTPTFTLPATADHVSGDSLYIAVFAHDAVTVTVLSVTSVLDTPVWHTHVVDTSGNTGYHATLFSDGPGGYAHIAYVNFTSHIVKLARALTDFPEAAEDWALSDVAFSPSPLQLGGPLDAQFINGKPAVVYAETTEDDLLYAYADTAQPSGLDDFTEVLVDPGPGALGLRASLSEISRHPRIAFPRTGLGVLFAASDTAIPGPSDWQVTLAVPGSAGAPALATIDSLPLLTLQVLSEEWPDMRDLTYARAFSSTPGGPGSWSRHAIWLGPTGYGGTTSIALIDTPGGVRPAVACIFAQRSSVPFCRALSATPESGDDWLGYDLGVGTQIEDVSLAEVGGRPAVVCCEYGATGGMPFRWATSAEPSSASDWEGLEHPVEQAFDGAYVSLAEVFGRPAVAYMDATNQDLKYAYLEP